MTRDEAIKTVRARSGRFVCSDEMANCLIETWTAMGMLKLDPEPPQTLWELLRKHKVDLTTAQFICNDALANGVSVPCSPQEGAVPHE